MHRIQRSVVFLAAVFVVSCGGGDDRAERPRDAAADAASRVDGGAGGEGVDGGAGADASTDDADGGSEGPTLPNLVLMMTDDQGWGDTGYNGHPVLETPHLDRMAREGIRFDRFYAGAPICSPTRGSVLTGRHPFRYGIFGANAGTGPSKYLLPLEELTLPEVLTGAGYATGHFGKWHLGDFEGEQRSSPDQHGYETYFATLRKTPTVDPVGYWENGVPVDTPLIGDDSEIVMERVLAFIDDAVERDRPFLAIVWFHTPHRPILATDEYRAMYEGTDHQKNYWGSLTAMDDQIGRLRARLDALGVGEDTMLWFNSDNGPELVQADGVSKAAGRTGGLRDGKRTLFEGGVRVPGLVVWPGQLEPRIVDMPVSTLDIYPTVLDYVGITPADQVTPLDGISLRAAFEGRTTVRSRYIPFETIGLPADVPPIAIASNGFKFYTWLDGTTPELLYDLDEDPGETNNIIAEEPALADRLREALRETRRSWSLSRAGFDYR